MSNSPSTGETISLANVVIQKPESKVHHAELSAGDVEKLPALETAKPEELRYGRYVRVPDDPNVVGFIVPEKVTDYMLGKESESAFRARNYYTPGELMRDYLYKPISPRSFSIIQCQVKKPQNILAFETVSESLLGQVGMVDPANPESLKEFGLITLGECADLLLAKDPEVFVRLPQVDRADLLRQVIGAYVSAGRIDLATALFERTRENDHFFFSDGLANAQLSCAKHYIEKGTDADSEENVFTSVDYNREHYARNVVCMISGIDDKAKEISTALIDSQYQKARELAEQLFEDRKDKTRLIRFLGRVDALEAVDQGEYEEGFTSYLETRPPQEDDDQQLSRSDRDDVESYEQHLGFLLQAALGKDADPAVVLPVLGGFKDQAYKARVQIALVHKSLDRDLVDDAVKYAENIELPHWRPGAIGNIVRHQHSQGRSSQDLLTNALERAHISEDGHRNQIFGAFTSQFVFDFGGLVALGGDVCKK